MTPEQLIAAEDRLVKLWNDGEVNSLTHFSGSVDGRYEEWLCKLFSTMGPNDWVLCSHRAHYHKILHDDKNGADFNVLADVKAGRSMFMYGPRFIQSAIVAGLCGVAAGIAMSIKKRGGNEHVWHFGGDGCEDQGAFYEAVRLVDGHNLPCTFIIEDNHRQCGVSKTERKVRNIAWPDCVVRHCYEPKYPHAGTDVRPNLKSQEPPDWLRK